MVSNTAQGVLNHKPETSGSSLERTCPRGTPLPGPPHAMDGQCCGNSATTGWRSGQPRQHGERGFHSVFPGLVDLSTKSILLIVSLQDMPHLDGSQARQFHAQPAMGTLGGVGLE